MVISAVSWPEDLNPTPIELYLDDPTTDLPFRLPGHAKERRRLDGFPRELCISKTCDWETKVTVRRSELAAAYEFLYEGSHAGLPGLDGDPDDILALMGFWD